MGEVSHLLPRLTVNRRFIAECVSAESPCCALGVVEERGQQCGFLAIRPEEGIPSAITDTGFRFGHTLFGTASFEVVHFAFEFYHFKTYNVLVNPSNPIVRSVLTMMVESGDYFFFALGPQGGVTAFRSAIGQEDMAGLKANFPRIQRSVTTEAQYLQAVAAFEKYPQPAGVQLQWVCRESIDALDLTRDRLDMTPAQE